MTTPAQTTLLHAAELLEERARRLHNFHNPDEDEPQWNCVPKAKATHDDALCTALELRLLARSMQTDTHGCKGIPALGCGYLSSCGVICNKCGKVHDPMRLVPNPQVNNATSPRLPTIEVISAQELRQQVKNMQPGHAAVPPAPTFGGSET